MSQSTLLPTLNTSRLPDFQLICDSELPTPSFEEYDIFNILTKVDCNKATGPDNISNELLKNTSVGLAYPLMKLINKSLEASIFPSCWKNANVIPVHKKNRRDDITNYRPISLLPNASKVMEKLIYVKLNEHLQLHNLLPSSNSGFKQGDGTVYQLSHIIHKLNETLDKGLDARLVFLDYSKAFDKVWHKGLLFKLKQMGLSSSLLLWFESYLSNRSQKVVIKGQTSDPGFTTSGVPQGSILGPLLFLVYVYDLPHGIVSNISSFADDTFIWNSGKNPDLITNILTKDLETISNWSARWLMSLNASKTRTITISNKATLGRYDSIILNGEQLEEVMDHSHLGLRITNNLSWNRHVDVICKRAGQRINILRKLSYKIPMSALNTIYTKFISDPY